MKKLLLVIFAVIVLPLPSSAWNYEGHMTVAAIGYRTLSGTESQKIRDILSRHPWFTKWQQEYQQMGPTSGLTFEQYIVMRAATWPDDIRGNPQYHRATWHYVNFPLRPPNTLNTNNSIGGDLLPRIGSALAVLATTPTTNAQRTQRAIALSWLIHLIGDLHQPLHTGALRNNTYPQGDRGGNLFFVRRVVWAPVGNLHSFWDGLLGDSRNASVIAALASQLSTQIPPGSFPGFAGGTHQDWAIESARLALQYGYQFGLAGGPQTPLAGSSNPNQGPPLPPGYETRSRQLARRQVALSGYRLGGLLKQIP